MDQDLHFGEHPSEDELEAYALRHLTEEQVAAVETHLLVCEDCQQRLAELDSFIASMKAVTAEHSRAAARMLPAVAAWSRWQIAAGALAVGLIAVGFFYWNPASQAAPATIVLSAMRGGSVPAAAPAGVPLDLRILSTQLDGRPGFRVEIVTELGAAVWSGPLTQTSGEPARAHVDRHLSAGAYWVRLYGPDNQFLQEYGLRLD